MLKKLIDRITGNSCEEDLEKLAKENQKLKEQLVKKQEHINKTNAYYKKKLHHLEKRS